MCVYATIADSVIPAILYRNRLKRQRHWVESGYVLWLYIYKQEIEVWSFHFIWQSRTDRIKRDTLMQEYGKGGLKMINLKNYMLALKSTWIRRLIVNTSKCVSIFETMYTKINDLINRGLELLKD